MRFFWRCVIIAAVLFTTAFGFYLWDLYRQLETAFTKQEQFVPTRIYSDVTRIAAPQLRHQIEARLNNLGYTPSATEDSLSFQLHPTEYPEYLVPRDHPTLNAAGKTILLKFDGAGKNAPLQSLQLESQEIPEIYLEPELVATLSRGAADSKEIRAILKFQDVPDPIWKAIIAVEDQHFLEHNGLDPRGILRAIWVNLRTRSFAQGGSTITQQLVKNLMARRTKNIFRKINELFLSLLLEARYDKTKILERYLNEVYLGQVGNLEVHGVEEGAKHFFGKSVNELNLAETALMAGLIRGPGYYSPYRYRDRAIERQRFVLKKMAETHLIAEGEAQEALNQAIRLAPPQSSANKAPYFTDFVKAELIQQLKDHMSESQIIAKGFRVYTTLDTMMNNAAQRAVSLGISDLEKRSKMPANERLEGALASVEHSTGYIRALVGGRNYAQSNFNRILNMRRQVGSTFKPIVYLSALHKGEDPNGIPYGAARPLEDAPWKLTYDKGRQNWSPKNYENEFRGWITMRTALAHSVNTVAAKLGAEVGIDKIIETARALGIESELPPVPSLSLGVAELSPVELLNAYATIANHGIQNELTVIRGITENGGEGFMHFVHHPKQAYPQGPIDLLIDLLQSVFTEGTAKLAATLGFNHPAAGKTGTTSNHRDSWFAGFTPQITTVVWVGSDMAPNKPIPEQNDDKEMKTGLRLTGATSALPIWVSFMKEVLEGEPPTNFPSSPYLTSVRVDRHSGKAASWTCPDGQSTVEKYLIGHEPKDSGCEPLYPASVRESTM